MPFANFVINMKTIFHHKSDSCTASKQSQYVVDLKILCLLAQAQIFARIKRTNQFRKFNISIKLGQIAWLGSTLVLAIFKSSKYSRLFVSSEVKNRLEGLNNLKLDFRSLSKIQNIRAQTLKVVFKPVTELSVFTDAYVSS